MMKQRPFLPGVVGAAIAAVLISACSSGNGPATGAGAKVTTVTIAADTPSVFLTDFYIAQQKGLFAKHSLDVKMTYSQNPAAVISSGKADLVYQSVLPSLQAIQQGLDLKATMTVQVNTLPILLANKSVSSLAQLQSLSSCRIGTTAPGNTVYGYATYWAKILRLKCSQAIASSVPTMVAGAVSGAYQAVVTTPQYGPETAPKGTHVLLNPLTISASGTPSVNQAFVTKYALPKSITTALWGEASYVNSNGTVIKNLRAALAQAQQVRKTMTFDQLAGLLVKANPQAFSPSIISHSLLVTALRYGITPVIEQTITPGLWTSSLKAYSYYGVKTYQASNPLFAFDKVVVHS